MWVTFDHLRPARAHNALIRAATLTGHEPSPAHGSGRCARGCRRPVDRALRSATDRHPVHRRRDAIHPAEPVDATPAAAAAELIILLLLIFGTELASVIAVARHQLRPGRIAVRRNRAGMGTRRRQRHGGSLPRSQYLPATRPARTAPLARRSPALGTRSPRTRNLMLIRQARAASEPGKADGSITVRSGGC